MARPQRSDQSAGRARVITTSATPSYGGRCADHEFPPLPNLLEPCIFLTRHASELRRTNRFEDETFPGHHICSSVCVRPPFVSFPITASLSPYKTYSIERPKKDIKNQVFRKKVAFLTITCGRDMLSALFRRPVLLCPPSHGSTFPSLAPIPIVGFRLIFPSTRPACVQLTESLA